MGDFGSDGNRYQCQENRSKSEKSGIVSDSLVDTDAMSTGLKMYIIIRKIRKRPRDGFRKNHRDAWFLGGDCPYRVWFFSFKNIFSSFY